jgi:RNA polymerase sigma-70 factor (ECF subfamily)
MAAPANISAPGAVFSGEADHLNPEYKSDRLAPGGRGLPLLEHRLVASKQADGLRPCRQTPMSPEPRPQDGAAEQFEELFARYERKIFNLLLRLVGDYEDAADLTSETFVRALRAADKFRGEAQAYTWLYRIAVNLSKNYFRSKAARPETPVEGEVHSQPAAQQGSPEALMQQRELQREVERALLSLPPEARLLILLRDVQGLTYQEIAEVTDSTPDLVKSRLFRARSALRRKLAPYLLPEA